MCRLSIFLLSLLFFGVPALAGPGHDDGDEAAAILPAHVPRVECTGSELELVATAEERKLTIYLDRRDTNEPVDGATIEVSGEGIEPLSATPVADGVYEIEADWVYQPGTKALIFTVTTNETADLLSGTLDLSPHSVVEEVKAVTWSAILVRSELWVLVALAVLFGFVLAFAFRPIRLQPDEELVAETPAQRQLSVIKRKQMTRTLLVLLTVGRLLSTAALAGPGHDHGAVDSSQLSGDIPRKLPDGDVFVPKPSQRLLRVRTAVAAETNTRTAAELVGTIISDPSSEGRVQSPMDGKIELAEGKVSFVGQAVKAGDLLALLTPTMPVYERGYLEQLTAEVDGKLRIAEQRLRRLQNISKGYVAQKEIEDTLTELESLREQKHVLEPKSAQKLELKAPVSGIISAANVRAGHVVNTGDILFQIVDPKRLWVEAIAHPGHDLRTIEMARAIVSTGRTVPLSYMGRSPTVRAHARPIYFQIGSPLESLTIGEVVKVVVQDGAPLRGITLPADAIVRGVNGLHLIWEKVSAERFRPLPVLALPLDGKNVIVTAGLEAGRRVVVEGAELINQIR